MSAELLKLADLLESKATDFLSKHENELKALSDAAGAIGKSWSGSNLGYHSLVYYEGFVPRPPGARFSIEWGLLQKGWSTTVGAWKEYTSENVKDAIHQRKGCTNLSGAKDASIALTKIVNRDRSEFLSILSASLDEKDDSFLEGLRGEVESIVVRSYSEFCEEMLPSGSVRSRDSNAVAAGLITAPHQEVIAETIALLAPANAARKLAEIARKSGSHMSRMEKSKQLSERIGTSVFIGHGGSPLWRELKDFIVDRLSLPHEEFNRVPVAGITNITRLSEMLDSAGCALILLTAEDEQADGAMHARMNVIHEVGLFQGRLGFTKAIVVLEDGCEEFTNIQGLGQIRFPKGNISAAFEEIRAVLEREEMIQP